MRDPVRDPMADDVAPGWAAGDEADAYSVNGRVVPWRPGLTLADVVESVATLAIAGAVLDAAVARSVGSGATEAPRTVWGPLLATSVNGRFVARARRPSVRIAPGDQVLVFQPIVGG
jgi:sulfur carrier protein ThiS